MGLIYSVFLHLNLVTISMIWNFLFDINNPMFEAATGVSSFGNLKRNHVMNGIQIIFDAQRIDFKK